MGTVLGLHLGHHSSCAIVRDGRLLSAVQTERHSRIKYHALETFCDRLPIAEALDAAGIAMSEVDLIVSSLQAAGAASFGLHQPLIAESFRAFDPFARHHFVVSHHLAHAHCAVGTSGFEETAVLVCDYGGSTSFDGSDFALPFEQWYRNATSESQARSSRTECLSIYRTQGAGSFQLLEREYAIAHCQPRTFVGSAASLYDNVTGAVLGDANGHGQLMALGAFAKAPMPVERLVSIDGNKVQFRNDWQHLVPYHKSFDDGANLARACQDSFEQVLLAYCRRAHELSGLSRLAVAGGAFLNILANTRLAQEGPFGSLWVPSAPHDAGISVGCAFWGARQIGDLATPTRVRTDRLGIDYDNRAVDAAIEQNLRFVESTLTTPALSAEQLAQGRIIARFAGRAEFGPRALGGRSLLATPCLAESKTRLNEVKGRQWWRPVAPIIQYDRLPEFFDGPQDSPWMTFSHDVPERLRAALPALEHPDHSTRAQSLEREQDPWLYQLLGEFAKITGFPILVNTSLNGPGQPILETPLQAIEWFLQSPGVDCLLLGDRCLRRRALADVMRGARVRWHGQAVLSFVSEQSERAVLVHGSRSRRLSAGLSSVALALRDWCAVAEFGSADEEALREMYALVVQRSLLVEWREESKGQS